MVLIIILIVCLLRFDKVNLFFLSFMPLFLILLFELFMSSFSSGENNSFSKKINFVDVLGKELVNPYFLILLAASICPVILFFIKQITVYKRRLISNKKLNKPERLNDDGIISYIMTYIVPLMSLNNDTSIVTYVINVSLFLVIMILYIKLDLFYINPVIELKYNIFKCEMDGDTKYIMTNLKFAQFKDKISNNSVNLQKVSNTLYKLV